MTSLAATVQPPVRSDFERWRRRSRLIRRLRVILPTLIVAILAALLGFIVHTTFLGREAKPREADAPIESVEKTETEDISSFPEKQGD